MNTQLPLRVARGAGGASDERLARQLEARPDEAGRAGVRAARQHLEDTPGAAGEPGRPASRGRMRRQLRHGAPPRLDRHTRQLGMAGVAAAREALRRASSRPAA